MEGVNIKFINFKRRKNDSKGIKSIIGCNAIVTTSTLYVMKCFVFLYYRILLILLHFEFHFNNISKKSSPAIRLFISMIKINCFYSYVISENLIYQIPNSVSNWMKKMCSPLRIPHFRHLEHVDSYIFNPLSKWFVVWYLESFQTNTSTYQTSI